MASGLFLTGLNCTVCSTSVVMSGREGLLLSSLLGGDLRVSRRGSGWLELLSEGRWSFRNMGSSGGAGGSSKGGRRGRGAGKEAAASGSRGLSGGGGGRPASEVREQKGARASGGGGGNTGERGRGEPGGQAAGGAGGEARAGSSRFTVPLPSVEALEESEVDEEETDTDEIREDFLSGTLGLALALPLAGDADLRNTGTGVSAVGVLDWLEYPLDGEVTRWDFSGDGIFGLVEALDMGGTAALAPSGTRRAGPLAIGTPGFPGCSLMPV